MPTCAATARAARSLSPVSRTGRRPRLRSPATASAEVALTVSATTSTARRRAVPRRRTRACGRRPRRRRGPPAARPGRCSAQSARKRSRPATTAWPSTTPCTPRPSRLANDSTGASTAPRSRAPAATARAIGCSDASSTEPARSSAVAGAHALGRDHVDQRHAAGGDRAGLVEHDRVDPAGRLQHLGALDEDAELGAPARADHEGGRRGQAQGARAGDDQDRHRGGERGGGAVGGSRRDPEPEGGGGQGDDDGDEHRRTPGRRGAAPGPCRSGPPRPGGRSGPARCRRPTRVASTTRRPPALTVAPVTASPGPTSTGTGSPVSSEASMAEVPSTTMPSVATFSPGRTTKRSPTASRSTGMRLLQPVAQHGDVLGAQLEQGPQRGARPALGPGLRGTGRRG